MKKEEELEHPTLDRMRRFMSMVYRYGQRYGLIPRTQESNPTRFVRCKTTSGYEAMIITPEQAYAIVRNLREPERTLTLLAAVTGLRISQCLEWYRQTPYHAPTDWVFATDSNRAGEKRGKQPLWLCKVMGYHIQPIARKLGIKNASAGTHSGALIQAFSRTTGRM